MKSNRRDFLKNAGIGIAGIFAMSMGLPVLANAKPNDLKYKIPEDQINEYIEGMEYKFKAKNSNTGGIQFNEEGTFGGKENLNWDSHSHTLSGNGEIPMDHHIGEATTKGKYDVEIDWDKKEVILDPPKGYVVPRGHYEMNHSKFIPKGWALCDGQNGTFDFSNLETDYIQKL